MTRILVVANQTLGGAQLQQEIHERLQADTCNFFVVVPRTMPQDMATGWVVDDPVIGADLRAKANEQALDDALLLAEGRLRQLLADIRDQGGQADGVIGDPNPEHAIAQVMAQADFDEVIVSTLPSRLSHWLRIDLPSRLERHLDIPVTTVIAE